MRFVLRLNPKRDLDQRIRNAVIEILARSTSTPTEILEAICPDQTTGLLNLLAAHPNTSPQL